MRASGAPRGSVSTRRSADHRARKEGPRSPQLRCGCGALLPTDVRCPCREEPDTSREKGTREGAAARRVGPPPLHLAYCATLFTLELRFRGRGRRGGAGSEALRGRDADPGTNLGRGTEQGWRTGEQGTCRNRGGGGGCGEPGGSPGNWQPWNVLAGRSKAQGAWLPPPLRRLEGQIPPNPKGRESKVGELGRQEDSERSGRSDMGPILHCGSQSSSSAPLRSLQPPPHFQVPHPPPRAPGSDPTGIPARESGAGTTRGGSPHLQLP